MFMMSSEGLLHFSRNDHVGSYRLLHGLLKHQELDSKPSSSPASWENSAITSRVVDLSILNPEGSQVITARIERSLEGKAAGQSPRPITEFVRSCQVMALYCLKFVELVEVHEATQHSTTTLSHQHDSASTRFT